LDPVTENTTSPGTEDGSRVALERMMIFDSCETSVDPGVGETYAIPWPTVWLLENSPGRRTAATSMKAQNLLLWFVVEDISDPFIPSFSPFLTY
jgi:hypothetical protein